MVGADVNASAVPRLPYPQTIVGVIGDNFVGFFLSEVKA